MSSDYDVFRLGDLPLLKGGVLKDARLAYKTYGTLAPKGDNVVVMPTFYTGSHDRNEGFFGPGRALDPARHYIVSVNLFGNGVSSSPSNTEGPQSGGNFPAITLHDNIAAQNRLLTERLGVTQIALVTGWSMAGCQSYQWAVQYPEMVKAILPFCASARTSPHNFVFLEGVKAALCADPIWNGGHYDTQPVEGLGAFGRVYAGWAFSQTFYRTGLYRQLGYDSPLALMDDWARDHAENWDANDLLCKLATWQAGDVSAGPRFNGDYKAALGSIRARTILMPCTQDLYFPPEDNEIEATLIPGSQFAPYNSDFGHCAANPGNDPGFTTQLDMHAATLLAL
ncbi:alpha/beta fold hydrolase [Ruegeria sp. 2012CJ41-6]|uniref:Alpha/beta fold hydrolase n=1 Tax=Ruegeria spongiae TaxID=2942209 RepID=A0ABT0Q7M9_9RHOB|nr:alpha/beta fold hydrolase [Ruegeria spongiae]MCL6285860.1 alpha/beta fold hydrolase [Ruegeria spongiae]